MATWKKVIVSGSSANLADLQVDSLTSGEVVIGGGSSNLTTTAINGTGNIVATTGASGVSISGSFSGSFQGDGSQLTGVIATALAFELTGSTGIDSFTFDGSAAAQVAVSGASTLNSNTVTKWTGTAFANTNITDDGSLVNVNSNVQVTGSLVQGVGVVALGSYAHAEGNTTQAIGDYSHAEGYTTIASGSYSHAEGSGTTALGDGSHAEGYETQAIGAASHAEGFQAISFGDYSHAEGESNIASGSYSHAEGQSTTALGDGSHAEGYTTIASGQGSHAEGSGTTASGLYSHAEGNTTTAQGDWSHAEGTTTQAIGAASHAEGFQAISFGDYSHAEGAYTIASGSYQHVSGKFNTHGDDTSLFIIGNGTDDNNRSDIFRVSGSTVQVTGSLTVSGSQVYLQTNDFRVENVDLNGSLIEANLGSGVVIWDSLTGSGSADFNNRQLIKSDGITVSVDWENGLFSGSFSGSFQGDGSQLTGIATTLLVSGSTGGASVNLQTQTLTIQGTVNEVETSATGQTVTIGLPNDVTVSNNLTVGGNLTVNGTTTIIDTTNTSIKDQFILLASGSTSTIDAGIIVQNAAAAGEALYWENNPGSVGRWAIASNIAPTATTVTAAEYMVTAITTAGAPSAAPTYGGATTGYGNIYVDSGNGDIYIYS